MLPSLYIALDAPDKEAALALAKQCQGLPLGFKVGMELFYGEGMPIVRNLQALSDYPVFVDLKLHDIPVTVERAAANLVRQGVRFFNIHAQGGPVMMEAAKNGAIEALPATDSEDSLTILAVTLLTSLSAHDVNQHLQANVSPNDYVAHLAKASQAAGLNGVVCSAKEATVVRDACGEGFLKITPGIRLPENIVGDQQRVMTPEKAIHAGATTLVVGRPITQAANPCVAAQTFCAAVASASCAAPTKAGA